MPSAPKYLAERASLGVSALALHFHAARGIGPFQNGGEVAGEHGLLGGDVAPEHAARGAINGDRLAFLHNNAKGRHGARFIINAKAAGPHHAGLAHAAGNHRRVGEKPAARGQHAFGGMHALNILRAGFTAHKYARPVARLKLLGFGGIKHHLARNSAGRCGNAGYEYLVGFRCIKGGMQKLVKHQGINAQDCFFLGEQALTHHIHQGFQFNPRTGLGGLGLQKPELAILNREGDFLNGFDSGAQPYEVLT